MASTIGGVFDPVAEIDLTKVSVNGLRQLAGTTAPISGYLSGTGLNVAPRGSTYIDAQQQVTYYNEGSAAAPYWTPLAYSDHPNLLGGYTDFRDGAGFAHATTAYAALPLAGSGLRMFGSGIVDTDSGVVVTYQENGPRARMTASATDAKTIALSFLSADGASTMPYQPDTTYPMVVEAVVNQVTALTLRRFFIGFLGTAADALVSPATGATVTITLVQDDLGGLYFDAGLTAATALCAIFNNNDGLATTTVAATDTGTVVPAAGTSCLFRVEVDVLGTMRCFRNRVLVATKVLALDITEEFSPVLLLASTSSAIKAMDVIRFGCWARRPNP
mgnify:CR=1 FL=1